MAGRLAYDPERVRLLRATMAEAHGQLVALLRRAVADDPLAYDATAAVRRAAATLEGRWLPFVDRLLACRALTESVDHLGPDDVRGAVARQAMLTRGWATAEDPLALTRPLTAAEARLLADWLLTASPARALDTDAERTWLATQLHHLAADTRLARTFVDAVSTASAVWGTLVEALAGSRSASAGAALAALAAVWARARPGAVPPLGDIQPFAAASFVVHLRLAADEMARVAGDLLRRWHYAEPSGAGWWDKGLGGPNTADVLFAWLLGDTAACAQFVRAEHRDLRVLLHSAADATLTHRVVLAGTHPTATGGLDLVLAVLRAIRRGEHLAVAPVSDGFDPDWPALLGALVAPWLIHFSPLAPGDHLERRDLLAMVLDDEQALASLVAARAEAVSGLTELTSRDPAGAADVATVAGLLGELVMRERLADEATRQQLWDFCWQLLAVPTLAIPGVGRRAARVGLGAAQHFAEENGWMGAPNPALVARRQGYADAWLLTVGGATMVRLGVERMVERGDLPTTVARPPSPDPNDPRPQLAYERAYRHWRDTVFAGRDPALAAEIDGWKGYFLSTADAGRNAAAD